MGLSVMDMKELQANSGMEVGTIPDEPLKPIQETDGVKIEADKQPLRGNLGLGMQQMLDMAVFMSEKYQGAEHIEGFRRCVEEIGQEIWSKKQNGEMVTLADEIKMLSDRWEMFSKDFLATTGNEVHLGDIFEIQGLIQSAAPQSVHTDLNKVPQSSGGTVNSLPGESQKTTRDEISLPQITSGASGFSMFGGLGQSIGKGLLFPVGKVASGLKNWRVNSFVTSLDHARKSIDSVKQAVANIKANSGYAQAMQAKIAGDSKAYQEAINSPGYREAEAALSKQVSASQSQFKKASKDFLAIEQYGDDASKDALKEAVSEFESALNKETESLPNETKEQMAKIMEAIVKMVEALFEKIGLRKKLAA